MIYEWRCQQCNKITEATRTVANRDIEPESWTCEHGMSVRVISLPNHDFEHMRDKGILERLE